ncbi:MAG: hypothetical protein ABTQ73_05940 [Caldilineales bacterium]|jgi:hypothetical protein
MPASRQPRISQRHRWYQWLVLTGILCAAFAVMPAQAETPASGPVPPALTATPAGVGATATPSSELRFAFGDATLRLPTGTEKGTVHLTISAEATGKEPVPAGEIEVVDIKQLGPTVDFKRVAEYQSSGKGRIWFLKADVSALPINSVPLTRSALVSLGEFKRIVPYVLTNRPASAPDFSITPPALWQRNSDNEVAAALLVAAGEQALLGLRLAHVSLTEKTQQQRSIPLQALELCTLPTDDVCVAPPVIPAQSSQTVYLRFKKGEKFLGRFSGTVSLAVDARAEAKPVPVDLASTACLEQWIGGIVIAAGVYAAFRLSAWSRSRLHRLAALQPVAAARERVLRLLMELDPVRDNTGVNFDATRNFFKELINGLTEDHLKTENLLPPTWSVLGTVPDTTSLQAHLKKLEPAIAGLAVVVNEGALPLLKRWESDPDPVSRTRVKDALQILDAPENAKTEDEAVALVARAKTQAQPPQPIQAQQAPDHAAPRTPLTLQRISAEIETINKTTWYAYLFLTSVAGIATLILVNPGFGSLLDFVYCLFWGFGLPIALEKLQQLSPSAVAKPLGITLPS